MSDSGGDRREPSVANGGAVSSERVKKRRLPDLSRRVAATERREVDRLDEFKSGR
ncbi:hypothetical protein [Halorubrum sp. BOL3-1]|uniref:hypothetical protein n=1 Tax=Halorubrum sp. BOL3-1 TaxID=2497325 RepID=UPI00140797D5|nr:hypothetical protein [Halorubrum sp. BOL3-1]